MDDLITAAEAAKLLHLHVKRVQHLARIGQLPATRFGRKWLFSRSKLSVTRLTDSSIASVNNDSMGALELSARNRLRGTISSIVADGVMAEVRIQIADQEIVSIITRSSAERLRLAVGDEVFAVVKSTEVMIAKGV
ncbi:MAG TPA: TOBE domain-containing protein [Gemmatimonadaceae bacterium]|jgi:molybdopterin-binding protein|nr:TOBE domain-containing protein [Gemmatimonadaceae bacterium]